MSFLQELQKYDLHCHLDGSLSVFVPWQNRQGFLWKKKISRSVFWLILTAKVWQSI